MFSSIDTLASLVETQPWALLTTMDRDGSLHTRPVKSLRAPFRGQIWLDAGGGRAAGDDVGEGTEVSVSFGDASHGPYVSVSGWAVVLGEHDQELRSARRQSAKQRRVLCVTARAAQLWESATSMDSRVFAFPALHAPPTDETAPPLPPRARSSSSVSMEEQST